MLVALALPSWVYAPFCFKDSLIFGRFFFQLASGPVPLLEAEITSAQQVSHLPELSGLFT